MSKEALLVHWTGGGSVASGQKFYQNRESSLLRFFYWYTTTYLINFFCRRVYRAALTDLVGEISLLSTCLSYTGRPAKHVEVPKDKMVDNFHSNWEKSLREAREPQSPKQIEELDSRPEVNNPPATGADNSPLTSRCQIDPQPNHIWVHCSIQVDSDSSDNSDYPPLATELEKEMASKHRQVEEENNGEDDSDGRVLVPSKLQQ